VTKAAQWVGVFPWNNFPSPFFAMGTPYSINPEPWWSKGRENKSSHMSSSHRVYCDDHVSWDCLISHVLGHVLHKILWQLELRFPNRAWWHMPIIPAFRRLRQEGYTFRTSLDDIMRPCLKKWGQQSFPKSLSSTQLCLFIKRVTKIYYHIVFVWKIMLCLSLCLGCSHIHKHFVFSQCMWEVSNFLTVEACTFSFMSFCLFKTFYIESNRILTSFPSCVGN
jgi:hypothetical protein